MKTLREKHSFTLIELVMVIIIIAILAGISLPLYLNLKSNSLDKNEESIIAALNIAIKAKYLENVVNGTNTFPFYGWPHQGDLFNLLENPPPHQVFSCLTSWDGESNDNIHWRLVDPLDNSDYYLFCCPHCTAAREGFYLYYPGKQKGRVWRYYIFNTPPYAKQGDIILVTYWDYHH